MKESKKGRQTNPFFKDLQFNGDKKKITPALPRLHIRDVRLGAVYTEKDLGPVSRKSRKLFGSEKPSVKLGPACSVKLVFPHDVKGRKIKITAKFRVLERFRFQDTKRIISPEKFRDFRETGPWDVSRPCGKLPALAIILSR